MPRTSYGSMVKGSPALDRLVRRHIVASISFRNDDPNVFLETLLYCSTLRGREIRREGDEVDSKC